VEWTDRVEDDVRTAQDEHLSVAAEMVTPPSAERPKLAGPWRRMLDAFYAGRMASAQREIERRRDLVARLRQGLVERGEHLVAVQTLPVKPAVSRLRVVNERVRTAIASGSTMMAQWRQRLRMRSDLATLGDGDLSDIRWTRAEVEAECRKPFWRA
jgi:uncharacterized protein YjiS (DUF1127 family)